MYSLSHEFEVFQACICYPLSVVSWSLLKRISQVQYGSVMQGICIPLRENNVKEPFTVCDSCVIYLNSGACVCNVLAITGHLSEQLLFCI